jgi:hypothetical protein
MPEQGSLALVGFPARPNRVGGNSPGLAEKSGSMSAVLMHPVPPDAGEARCDGVRSLLIRTVVALVAKEMRHAPHKT